MFVYELSGCGFESSCSHSLREKAFDAKTYGVPEESFHYQLRPLITKKAKI